MRRYVSYNDSYNQYLTEETANIRGGFYLRIHPGLINGSSIIKAVYRPDATVPDNAATYSALEVVYDMTDDVQAYIHSSNGDKIYITDKYGEKVTYEIYNIYQTDANDASYSLEYPAMLFRDTLYVLFIAKIVLIISGTCSPFISITLNPVFSPITAYNLLLLIVNLGVDVILYPSSTSTLHNVFDNCSLIPFATEPHENVMYASRAGLLPMLLEQNLSSLFLKYSTYLLTHIISCLIFFNSSKRRCFNSRIA